MGITTTAMTMPAIAPPASPPSLPPPSADVYKQKCHLQLMCGKDEWYTFLQAIYLFAHI